MLNLQRIPSLICLTCMMPGFYAVVSDERNCPDSGGFRSSSPSTHMHALLTAAVIKSDLCPQTGISRITWIYLMWFTWVCAWGDLDVSSWSSSCYMCVSVSLLWHQGNPQICVMFRSSWWWAEVLLLLGKRQKYSFAKKRNTTATFWRWWCG